MCVLAVDGDTNDTNDTNDSRVAEGDELSALGPEATETSPSGSDDEPMDIGALAALSLAGRRAADGQQAQPVQPSDAPSDETKLNLAAAGAGLVVSGPAAVAPATGTGRRGWLTLLVGVALGAAVSALALHRNPLMSDGAAPAPAQAVSAAPQPAGPGNTDRAQTALQASAELQPPPSPVAVAPAPDTAGAQPELAAAVSGKIAGAAQAAEPAVAAPAAPGIATPAAALVRPAPQTAAAGMVRPAPPTAAVGRIAPRASTNSPARGATPASSAAVATIKAVDMPSSEPAPSAAGNDTEEARLAAASLPRSSQNPLDAVLDDAFADRRAHAAKALANEAAALPLAPSRDDVTKAMTVLVPAMRGCAQGQSGLATAGIVVRNDGRVESVTLSGSPFAGTASGRCMEGVVRRARFPHFRQAAFRVQFPFALQ